MSRTVKGGHHEEGVHFFGPTRNATAGWRLGEQAIRRISHGARGQASFAGPHSGAASSGGRKSPRHEWRGQESKLRGSQLGKQNAFKHGFYSHLFRERERRILDEQPITDLSAEKELLHVTTTRFLEAMESSNRTIDFEASIIALRPVNLTAQSIAALVRVQTLTGARDRELREMLEEYESFETGADENVGSTG